MANSSCISFKIVLLFGACSIFLFPYKADAQQPIRNDSLLNSNLKFPLLSNRDSLLHILDSTYKNTLQTWRKGIAINVNNKKKDLLKSARQLKDLNSKLISESRIKYLENSTTEKKPLVVLKGGYVNYNFAYRSNIDTPLTEHNINQHNLSGNIQLTLAATLPISVTYLVRETNSQYFNDIADVQVSFDAQRYRSELYNKIRQSYLSLASGMNDSLLEKLYTLKKQQLDIINNWISNPLQEQKYRSYNEALQIPIFDSDYTQPESVNASKIDSFKEEAKQYLRIYDSTKAAIEKLKYVVDSLHNIVDRTKQNIYRYKQLANGQYDDWASHKTLSKELNKFKNIPDVPKRYKWMLGAKNLSIGRSPVNYSELTSKNLSIKGINLEYNSWYYIALAAGMVDYRFRDFIVKRFNATPQYMYMARIGVGKLERNIFIVSMYGGQKQLYAVANNYSNNTSVKIKGLSVETRIQLDKNTHILAELAESLAPDLRASPPVLNQKFSLSDKASKALSAKLYSYFPKTASRIEGMYKYTGANFQSFSTYQTNAELRTWYVKLDQVLFNKKLRVSGALRSNEFANPYIAQQYKSNTVFKNVNASLRLRKWPSLTIGYIPMSQLTILDHQVVENRFQTLNASVYHHYKVGTQNAATTIVYNKFYNKDVDTGAIYYNSTNIFLTQNFYFKIFTASGAYSLSKNSMYRLDVIENSIDINFKTLGSIGFGIKINKLNQENIKGGGYVNANIPITKSDILYLSWEKGFLPGSNGTLIRNEMATIQFTKFF